MSTSLRAARAFTALLAAAAASTLLAGTALAGGCTVTVEPATITVGQEFTVSGDFGGASIFIVPGEDGTVGEDAEPDATTPEGDSFSVTFTALGAATYTVWGLIEGSECGDSATLVVTGLPNTAVEAPGTSGAPLVVAGLTLFALGMVATLRPKLVRG